MHQPKPTRRSILRLAGIAAGTSATAACTGPASPDSPAPTPSATRTALSSAKATASQAPADDVVTRTGEFTSAFRPGGPTRWSLVTPAPLPDPQDKELPLPVAVFLHGTGSSSDVLVQDLAADTALQRHLGGGGARFAVAAVDGGDSWWHARTDGTDTQSMLVEEFVPMLGDQGFDLGRIGIFGLSMGGFGALLLASQARLPGVRAVAAMSPALAPTYEAVLDGAFDSRADFDANDVFGLRPRLAALPKRIDCGTADDLAAGVRQYRSDLPGDVEGGYQPGGHNSDYWKSVLPDVLGFLGDNLA